MKSINLLLLLVFGFCSPAVAQKTIELDSTPTDIVWKKAESQYFSPSAKSEIVANVSQPTLTAYLPDSSVANGTALIIAPGGGFHLLSINNEGTDVAKWCVGQGIAAFVLKYRLVPTSRDAAEEFFEKVQDRDKMDKDMAPVIALAKADGLAAVEYVRKHAETYHVNPHQIGIVGFSAGGTVAAAAAFEYTTAANRPDFSAPIYPALHVVNMEEMPDAPMPLFIAVTADDVFGFQVQSADLFKKWNKAGNPIEMHIYEKGGHGFGMLRQNLPSDNWVETFRDWLASHGWVKN